MTFSQFQLIIFGGKAKDGSDVDVNTVSPKTKGDLAKTKMTLKYCRKSTKNKRKC